MIPENMLKIPDEEKFPKILRKLSKIPMSWCFEPETNSEQGKKPELEPEQNFQRELTSEPAATSERGTKRERETLPFLNLLVQTPSLRETLSRMKPSQETLSSFSSLWRQ
jgi:hypothetical protein